MVVNGVRVRGLGFVVLVKAVNVLHDAFGECHEAIGGANKVGCKELVQYAWLVRYHIVYQCDSARFAVAFGEALNDTVAGSKERHPVARDKQVGLLVANMTTNFDPVERVARMDLLANV